MGPSSSGGCGGFEEYVELPVGICHPELGDERLAPHIRVLHIDPRMLRATFVDDFAISPIGARERNDLLELLDDRVGSRSTIICSQLPPKSWHEYLNDPTVADAIMDRLMHRSHKIHLESKESMRGRKGIAGGSKE
jgi:IstB-like ATP binding protein